MLQRMMGQFHERRENQFQIFENTSTPFNNKETSSNDRPSVRDQMLKPEPVEQNDSNGVQLKLPTWRDDRMYYSTR